MANENSSMKPEPELEPKIVPPPPEIDDGIFHDIFEGVRSRDRSDQVEAH